MNNALFTNFTDQAFQGCWNGRCKTFEPGQSLWAPDYLAEHFAKHLVNRELLRVDSNGNLKYKDGEKFTSPKKPEDVPVYMGLFQKAYRPEKTEQELGSEDDDIDALIGAANKNNDDELKEAASKVVGPGEDQIVLPPDYDEEEDDESAFQQVQDESEPHEGTDSETKGTETPPAPKPKAKGKTAKKKS